MTPKEKDKTNPKVNPKTKPDIPNSDVEFKATARKPVVFTGVGFEKSIPIKNQPNKSLNIISKERQAIQRAIKRHNEEQKIKAEYQTKKIMIELARLEGLTYSEYKSQIHSDKNYKAKFFTKVLTDAQCTAILNRPFKNQQGIFIYVGKPLDPINQKRVEDYSKSEKYAYFLKRREQVRKKLNIHEKAFEPYKKLQDAIDKSSKGGINRQELGEVVDELNEQAFTIAHEASLSMPSGANRASQYVGIGLRSRMEQNNLINPVEYTRVYNKLRISYQKKKATKNQRDMSVKVWYGFQLLMNEFNVSPQEAMDYVCMAMDNESIYRKHRVEKELFRGSFAFIELMDFYDEQKRITVREGKKEYSQNDLMNSVEYNKFCKDHNIEPITNRKTFNVWWKELYEKAKKEYLKATKL